MLPDHLNPGDRVVELAATAISVAIATGAVASASVVWLIKKSWFSSAGALVVGSAIGFVAGQLVARLLYRTAEHTTIVKVGSASLFATVRAGLAGGISTALVVGLLAILVFSARSQAMPIFSIAVACGSLFGVLFACLGSLT